MDALSLVYLFDMIARIRGMRGIGMIFSLMLLDMLLQINSEQYGVED